MEEELTWFRKAMFCSLVMRGMPGSLALLSEAACCAACACLRSCINLRLRLLGGRLAQLLVERPVLPLTLLATVVDSSTARASLFGGYLATRCTTQYGRVELKRIPNSNDRRFTYTWSGIRFHVCTFTHRTFWVEMVVKFVFFD